MPKRQNPQNQGASPKVHSEPISRERVAAMQQLIRSLASELDLSADFSRGRRSTDIMVIEVGGRLDRTLALYTRITDEFPDYDLELFNSGSGDSFGRKAAITRKLAEQPRLENERRARLKFSEEV